MRNLPVITKNILLINIVVFLIDTLLQRNFGIHIANFLGLFNVTCGGFQYFHLWQPFTYMFLHANWSHILCNMFAVLMFGPALEESWGAKRFLIYYLICGVGAALVQLAVWALFFNGQPGITIGASGAVFGVLLAFGWLFPEVKMFLLFIPIPLRARTFVVIYAVLELFAGIAGLDNVAHFAHLGGMLFGLLVIFWWKYLDKRRAQRLDNDDRFGHYHYQQPLR